MSKLCPILFSTEMVQAILDGRKTQTRRVVKPRSYITDVVDGIAYEMTEDDSQPINCPYGQPGDILWVRETFTEWPKGEFQYKANTAFGEELGKWKPSIHMPFAAARIFLRVKAVRVEPLQEITLGNVKAEGIVIPDVHFFEGSETRTNRYFEAWQELWQSINGPESWDANPWVWVVEFERISREEAGV